MENQLGAGEEPYDEGESMWDLSQCDLLTLRWLQAAYLEACNCQVESRYLEVLRQLQDTKSLDAAQQQAVQKLVADALKREKKTGAKQQVTRSCRVTGWRRLVPHLSERCHVVSLEITTITALKSSRIMKWRT